MSAGMADIIAGHAYFLGEGGGCRCGDWTRDAKPSHAAHVAEELAKAGYGNVQEALVAAADEMERERATWCLDESGRHWIARTLNDLRQRAHANDPEGRALVQAIHNRKAAGGLPGFDGAQNTLPKANGSENEATQKQHPNEDARHVALAADHDCQERPDRGYEQPRGHEAGAGTLGGFPRVFHGASITQPEADT